MQSKNTCAPNTRVHLQLQLKTPGAAPVFHTATRTERVLKADERETLDRIAREMADALMTDIGHVGPLFCGMCDTLLRDDNKRFLDSAIGALMPGTATEDKRCSSMLLRALYTCDQITCLQRAVRVLAASDYYEMQDGVQDGARKVRMCRVCGTVENGKRPKMRQCAVCKSVYYCSTECQRRDWSEHKKACSPFAAS